MCGPVRSRTLRSGEIPDTGSVVFAASARCWFGQGADAEGIDEGCAVVDLESAVVAQQSDGDAAPAGVDVQAGVCVDEFAAGVDAAFEAAVGVGVGRCQLDGGQLDAVIGEIDLGGEVLPDRLVRGTARYNLRPSPCP